MDEDNSTSESCEIISESNEECGIAVVQDDYDDVDDQKSWRGCSMDEIYSNLNPFELEHVAPVRPSADHTVIYRYPIRDPDTEPPRPLKAQPRWDAQHVRLPCSGKSQYPVTAANGTSTIESRWEMIEKALLRPITNSRELQAAILSYNTRYENQWDFKALHRLFEKDLDESESRVFFEDLLPRIIRLALRLPELVTAPIPLLRQNEAHTITLSQQQISSLLANAFLCTFPRRNTLKKKSEYTTFPDINFNNLFQSHGHSVLEKIKCICHYFRRVCPTERDSLNVPAGVVSFTRKTLQTNEIPNWPACEAPLGSVRLNITSEGTIEDQGLGLLQVDFANKYLGGGVLGVGCVQEEIRFVICPELMVSKLFTECLLPNEALLMVGCERYSNYMGYASTFKWAGNHEDMTPYDSSRRRMTHIVAIDALAFKESSHQFREELMLRELNKAYVGFQHKLVTPSPGVATGNWGCGAFGGDATLKALLQLMVCAAARRPLVYYTFGDKELRDNVHDLHMFCTKENLTVRDMWAVIKEFRSQKLPADELYTYIKSQRKKRRLNHPQKKHYVVPAVTVSEVTATSSSCIITANQESTLQLDSVESICVTDSFSLSPAQSFASQSTTIQDKSQTVKSSEVVVVAPKVKQLSLLEMLDKSYSNGQYNTKRGNVTAKKSSSPPSKRFCKSPK